MDDEFVLLLLYLDDIFMTRNGKHITERNNKLAEEFKMKYLGLMNYFLELEVWQSLEGIFLNQGKYAFETLKRFDMLHCKAIGTPMDTNLNLLYDESSKLVDMLSIDILLGH